MAKAAQVKCPICGEYFDRVKEPYEHIGNRYYHKKCYDGSNSEYIQELKSKEDFYQYIKEIYGPDYNYLAISRQAESYIRQYDFTYSGMLKTLKWFYEIENGDTTLSNDRIGIIPYIYEDARKYYYNLFLIQERNKNIVNYKTPVKEVTIESPRPLKIKPYLFNFEQESD